MNTNDVLKSLGTRGRYQILIYFLVSFVCMRGVWHLFAISFFSQSVSHHCTHPAHLPFLNKSKLSQLKCEMFTDSFLNVTEKCSHWTYDTNDSYTITQKWDLVCGRNHLSELSSTIFMVGTMSGAVFVSPLSDYIGRKPVILACLWIQAIFGVSLAFVESFVAFTVIRFFLGACNMAIGLVAYLLVTEVFPASSRTIPSIAIYLFWGVGIMVLALMAYLLPHWEHLQICISVPSFLTIIYYWILPESLPWLIAKEKFNRARQVLAFAAVVNGRKTPFDNISLNKYDRHNQNGEVYGKSTKKDCNVLGVSYAMKNDTNNVEDVVEITKETCCESEGRNDATCDNDDDKKESSSMRNWEQNCDSDIPKGVDTPFDESDRHEESRANIEVAKQKYTVLDLFRTPRIRIYTIVMFYLWFVNSLVYFGIMYAIPTFHGNTYLNMFLSGLVEIPAYLICMFLLQIFGRRWPLCLFMLLCGGSSLAYVFTPIHTDSGYNLTWLKITLAMIAKFAITGSYATIYLFSAEIYPTVIRNHGLGLASFFENIGGIASPFIAYSAKTYSWLPMAISGGLTVLGGLLCLVLPETHRRPLPETIEDVEKFTRRLRSTEFSKTGGATTAHE